ncbi:MAG: phosphoheptose isomerase [Bacteroidetes bacterium]|nr:phosphoheptose isomerase [Bacteroidota bacterium]
MRPVLSLSANKQDVFRAVEEHLSQKDFRIVNRALDKPWGGFYVIDESQAGDFASYYFPEVDFNSLKITANLSPKILVVAPNKRLSWQYHFRRAEIWRLVAGTAGITTSDDNVERHNRELSMGEIVRLKQGERHRLIGLETFGMIAEIWQHTDPANPSDESDIVRVQDDFAR